MARLEFFVVSRSVAIDQATNQASVFEILEVVQAARFPALIQQCVAVSLWRREPGDEDRDFSLVLRVTTPAGSTHEIRTNFRLSSPRHRVMQRIQGLPIEREGRLRFEAILNAAHAAEHLVDIEQAGELNPKDWPTAN